jgi:ATP-dependent helicase/nuclease subunit B
MRSSDLLTLLISNLQSGIYTGEKKPEAVELPGWLELLWEDAPHLIVAGMNDGFVPEVRQEDPFLHDKLRVAWGLASDASRLRRDSYLLLSMMAARADSRGRIDLLLARQDDEGSVLKPSRLLLRCADDADLPALVQELFRELPPRPNEKWRSAWALKPDHRTSPHTLSASALKDYLDCPTRFYLKHILKLKSEVFGAEEADSATFGTLLHTTLRDFGNDPKLRDLREEKLIEGALVHLWKQLFDKRYGNHPSFPLIYQREAAIRRLKGVACAQARLREEGWEIVACERVFDAFPVSGMRLRGQIDRIDRRITPTGIEWRIIDYKSSETKKDPAKEHHRPLSKKDHSELLAPYECFEQNEKIHRWIDLQLPLYRMVLLSEITSGHSTYLQLDQIMTGSVEVGYFIIPAKVNETGFLSFVEVEQDEESALACLQGVLRAINQGVFWPPRRAKYDNFEGLLFNHLEADSASGQQTLDPANLIPHSAEEVMS